MIARNSDGSIRGVSYFLPADVGAQQWTSPGPVFKGDDDPGGPESYDGTSAIASNPPWYDGKSQEPAAYSTPVQQVWTRPPVFHFDTSTGAVTDATAPPEQQSPLIHEDPFATVGENLESSVPQIPAPTPAPPFAPNPGQQPDRVGPHGPRGSGVVANDEESKPEPQAKLRECDDVTDDGQWADDEQSRGVLPKPTLEPSTPTGTGRDVDFGGAISGADVEQQPDSGTAPEDEDLPTGDLRWGPGCGEESSDDETAPKEDRRQNVPGPFSRVHHALIHGI